MGYSAATPHFGIRCLLYFLYTVIGLRLATKNVDQWRNLCTIISYIYWIVFSFV